jgi:hypothetical protein
VVERADVLLMQNWAHVVTGARLAPASPACHADPAGRGMAVPLSTRADVAAAGPPPPPAVFEALNRIPKEGHGVDMMRVRDWALRCTAFMRAQRPRPEQCCSGRGSRCAGLLPRHSLPSAVV